MTVREGATAEQHRRLRQMIMDGELPPGSVLLETPLSKQLGVSRTPVREALARLAQEGLITRRTRGYVVHELRPEEIIEVFDARIVLECAIAERAATTADDFQLTRIEQLTEELERLLHRLRTAGKGARAAKIRDEIRPLNVAWHAELRAAANSKTLTGLLEQILDVQRIYDPLMKQTEYEEIALGQRQHNEIVTALRKRDPQAAKDTMAAHLTTVRQSKIAEFTRTVHERT
ncbi:GntR family transcriptional regulator [Sciscionella marina]|uniref:GntR family transcriptional regulator n=1 Tax=Sciscionella marina TaxID=508770 RepID=UPI000376FD86|nr:GntR family transcriptional regulator [Sciscionella marina]